MTAKYEDIQAVYNSEGYTLNAFKYFQSRKRDKTANCLKHARENNRWLWRKLRGQTCRVGLLHNHTAQGKPESNTSRVERKL